MRGPKGWMIAAVLLWLAGGFQLSLSYPMSIWGASPDFLLVVVVVWSLFAERRNGAGIGFLAGTIQGAVAGGHLATYSVIRAIVGFLVGWLTGLEFEGNVVVAFIVTASATTVAQIAYLLLSPKGAILPFLLATIVSALYNGVLAMPLYALLKKVADSPRR